MDILLNENINILLDNIYNSHKKLTDKIEKYLNYITQKIFYCNNLSDCLQDDKPFSINNLLSIHEYIFQEINYSNYKYVFKYYIYINKWTLLLKNIQNNQNKILSTFDSFDNIFKIYCNLNNNLIINNSIDSLYNSIKYNDLNHKYEINNDSDKNIISEICNDDICNKSTCSKCNSFYDKNYMIIPYKKNILNTIKNPEDELCNIFKNKLTITNKVIKTIKNNKKIKIV
jgi:hypothetical protein